MICSCRLLCQICGLDMRGRCEAEFRDYRSWVHVESGIPCLYEPGSMHADDSDEGLRECRDSRPLTILSFVLRVEEESPPLHTEITAGAENVADIKVFIDPIHDVSTIVERLSVSSSPLRVAITLNKLSDEVVLDLILKHKVQSLNVKTIKEALGWVSKYLRVVSQEVSAGCVADKKPRVRKYIENEPQRNVWINQLELIPGISKDTAIRISERWNSPLELINWLELHSENDLSREVLNHQKPLGKIPARRLFKLYTAMTEPDDRIIV